MDPETNPEDSPEDNLTAVLYGIEDMRMEQRPIPEPGDNQVLIRMESVGVCCSDVHYYTDGYVGPFVLYQPMVIGHEASGTVIQAGKDVQNLKLGDRVAIEPGRGCRVCSFCKTGRYHLCPEMKLCATPPTDGNLTKFFVHDADFCFKLPDGIDSDDGALMEPLAVAVHSCKKAQVTFGDCVVIFGCGPVGLLTFLASRAYGATTILIIDQNGVRLDKAKEFGVTYTLQIDKDAEEDAILNKIVQILGEQPRVCFDCVGVQQCMRIALQVTKSGGVVVLIGNTKLEMRLPLASALTREIDVKGTFRYNNDYPEAIEMIRSGTIDLKPLITHHFEIEDSLLAFKTAVSGEGNPIKIIIHPNKPWEPPAPIIEEETEENIDTEGNTDTEGNIGNEENVTAG